MLLIQFFLKLLKHVRIQLDLLVLFKRGSSGDVVLQSLQVHQEIVASTQIFETHVYIDVELVLFRDYCVVELLDELFWLAQ